MTTVMHLPLADDHGSPFQRSNALDGARGPQIENDALYGQLLLSMQQGRWSEAGGLLATLEGNYPEAAELVNVRLSLALHLSAEESWSGKGRRAARWTLLPMPLVRALAVANLVLYALIILMLLLGRAG